MLKPFEPWEAQKANNAYYLPQSILKNFLLKILKIIVLKLKPFIRKVFNITKTVLNYPRESGVFIKP